MRVFPLAWPASSLATLGESPAHPATQLDAPLSVPLEEQGIERLYADGDFGAL